MATMLDNAPDESIIRLCLGIVKQAAKEYMHDYKAVKRIEKKKPTRATRQELRDALAKLKMSEDYFYSPSFVMFVEFDPDKLISLLREEVDNNIREGKTYYDY